jgi:hypothetical protein
LKIQMCMVFYFWWSQPGTDVLSFDAFGLVFMA